MGPKFSPGPWTVHGKPVNTGMSVTVRNRHGGTVCLMKDSAGRKVENAVLVSAAPELYEALERIEDLATHELSQVNMDIYRIAVEALELANGIERLKA